MEPVSDTRAEAARVQLAAIRARSPEARLRDAIELSEMVHGAAIAKLRARFPESTMLELVVKLHGGSLVDGDVKR